MIASGFVVVTTSGLTGSMVSLDVRALIPGGCKITSNAKQQNML